MADPSLDPATRPAIVYLVTNLVNGKRYIGVTALTVAQRAYRHKYEALQNRSGAPLHRAMRKYGATLFRFSVLERCQSWQTAIDEEVRLIVALRPEYNATKGGDGSVGYRHSSDARRKMSSRHIGRPGYWRGKSLPLHVAKLISARNLKPEAREKWRRSAALGPPSMSRPVICLNDGRCYESVAAAARAYGIDASAVSAVCRRSTTRLTAGRRVFRFLGDHEGGRDEALREMARARDNQRRLFTSQRKRVICLNDGCVHPSASAAGAAYGVSGAAVARVCNGTKHRLTAAGRRFAYVTGEKANAGTWQGDG